MGTPKRVLVTGSAGRIGRAAVKELLKRGHHVIGLDLFPTPGLPSGQALIGSVADAEAMRRAVADADCVVHLAATPDDARFPRGQPPDDGDNFLSELLPNNILGTYQVLEVARKCGLPRVVLASTGQMMDGYRVEQRFPITVGMIPRPRYLYACTKVFLESVGRVYAEQHGIEVLAVRLGWCPRDPKQVEAIRSRTLFQDVYLSPGDAGRFFALAVEAKPWHGYRVVFASSKPVDLLRYDLRPAEKLVGYVPQDAWPTGAEDF